MVINVQRQGERERERASDLFSNLRKQVYKAILLKQTGSHFLLAFKCGV